MAVGDKRSAFMPDLPSLGEEGARSRPSGYFGLFAPARHAKADHQRLNAEFTKAMSAPQVQSSTRTRHWSWEPNTPEQFAAFAKADRDAAAKVFKSIGIMPQAVPQ